MAILFLVATIHFVVWQFPRLKRIYADLFPFMKESNTVFMKMLVGGAALVVSLFIAGAFLGCVNAICTFFSKKITGVPLKGWKKMLDYILPVSVFKCGHCGERFLFCYKWKN